MLRETYTSTSQIYFHRQPVPLANGTSGKGLKVSHGQRWDFNHYKLYMFNGYKLYTGWWYTYLSEKSWTLSVGMIIHFPTEWKMGLFFPIVSGKS